MEKMNERKMLQKVVSFGSVFTNVILMTSITYTLLMLVGTLFPASTDIAHIDRASLPAVAIVLAALFALYYGVYSGVQNARLTFLSETEAARSTATSSLISSIAALAVVGILAGEVGVSSQLLSFVLVIAAVSCLIAYISYADYQHIAA